MTDTQAIPAEDYRSITLLNEMGDLEISWDSQNDDVMRQFIATKMAEGIRFFTLAPMLGGVIYRKKAMRTMDDLKENRVKVADKEVEVLFEAGKVALIRNNDGSEVKTTGIAKTPDEAVAARRTVGVRAMQGG